MLYDILAMTSVLLGVLLSLIAMKLLLRRGWLLAWLKGSFGFSIISLSVLVVLVGWDIYHYDEILEEKSIATISFEKLDEQYYRATLVSNSGAEAVYSLRGDQWQLDAKIFKWSRSLSGLGMKPGYRLDRLAGRYYSLEKERNAQRTVYDLHAGTGPVDVWQWCRRFAGQNPWIDTIYGSATFVPMSDGALYEINLSHSGLVARPLNERAQTAVNRWQ